MDSLIFIGMAGFVLVNLALAELLNMRGDDLGAAVGSVGTALTIWLPPLFRLLVP